MAFICCWFRMVKSAPDSRSSLTASGLPYDAAIINGVEGLHGAEVRACDLRAGAAVVIAGLCAAGETVVTDIRFIERGYENFVGKLRSIGADIVLERDGAEQCAAAAAE